MRIFEYRDEGDFISSIRFRLQCAMEKSPGIVIQDGKEYHVDNHGKWSGGSPPFHTETRQLMMDLIFHQK